MFFLNRTTMDSIGAKATRYVPWFPTLFDLVATGDMCFGYGMGADHFKPWMDVLLTLVILMGAPVLMMHSVPEDELLLMLWLILCVLVCLPVVPFKRINRMQVALALALVAPPLAWHAVKVTDNVAAGWLGKLWVMGRMYGKEYNSCTFKGKKAVIFTAFSVQSFLPPHPHLVLVCVTVSTFVAVALVLLNNSKAHHVDRCSLWGGAISRAFCITLMSISVTIYTMSFDGRSSVLLDNCGKAPVFDLLELRVRDGDCRSPVCVRDSETGAHPGMAMPIGFARGVDYTYASWVSDRNSDSTLQRIFNAVGYTDGVRAFPEGYPSKGFAGLALYRVQSSEKINGREFPFPTWAVDVQGLKTVSFVDSVFRGSPLYRELFGFFLDPIEYFWMWAVYVAGWMSGPIIRQQKATLQQTVLRVVSAGVLGYTAWAHRGTIGEMSVKALCDSVPATGRLITGLLAFVHSLFGDEGISRVYQCTFVLSLSLFCYYQVHSWYVHSIVVYGAGNFQFTVLFVAARSAVVLGVASESWLSFCRGGRATTEEDSEETREEQCALNRSAAVCVPFAFVFTLVHELFVHSRGGLVSTVGTMSAMVLYLVYMYVRDYEVEKQGLEMDPVHEKVRTRRRSLSGDWRKKAMEEVESEDDGEETEEQTEKQTEGPRRPRRAASPPAERAVTRSSRRGRSPASRSGRR